MDALLSSTIKLSFAQMFEIVNETSTQKETFQTTHKL